ncbi:MAG: hypothetical protein C0502_08975, partial [Opitutus sp.]|nr:hypothetical protein [Opitutus sp.]
SGVFPRYVGIQAYTRNHLATGDILLPRLPWPAESDGEIIPLGAFLLRAPELSQDTKETRLWRAQAGLLVRWALFGPELRAERTRALWALAEVARHRAITEEDFRLAFGMGFAEAEQQLAKFRDVARGEAPWIWIPGLLRDLPQFKFKDLKLRRATEAEVARLRGNFERLEMIRWRAAAPELSARYEAAARRTLKRGLRLASDDARVRGVYGLFEYLCGHLNEARPHLEAAFAANAASAPALLALARLRLADMRIGLPPEGTLPEEALLRVLDPLFAAKDHRPPVAEVFRLIGEVWAQSRVPPKREHLAVLLEGVRLFPADTDQVWQAAELHRRHGYSVEAIALARHGEVHAPDAEARGRFAGLRRALESGQPLGEPTPGPDAPR